MTGEWKTTTIDELKAPIRNAIAMGPFGSRIKTDNFVPEGVPVIRGNNLNAEWLYDDDYVFLTEEKADELWASNAFPGDIVITHRGTLGQVGIIPKNSRYPRYVVSQSQMKLTVDQTKADPYYVFYYLRSPQGQHQLLANISQTGVPAIAQPTATLKSIKIPLPNLDEQRAIALILGSLDDKIELNRRMNQTLEAIARALFKAWFIDFEPVRAKMEGRWRRGESLPGLPAYLYDLFPDRLVESELGEIPEGWEIKPLPVVIDVNPPRALRKGQLAPYLDMGSMPTRGHVPDATIERAFNSGMRFMNGDTLVARITPCLENGKTAYVDFLANGQVGWGSTEYIVLRPKPPLPTEFAYCLARTTEFREFAIQSMTGSSGRQRVSIDSLSHFSVTSPSKLIAEAFGTLVAPLFARASVAARESRSLAALRDALLPKLINGEIGVKDGEKLCKEVAR